MHGYELRVRLVSMLVDSAIAATERVCRYPFQTLSVGENYLLRRRGGKWLVDRVLTGWNAILAITLHSISAAMRA